MQDFRMLLLKISLEVPFSNKGNYRPGKKDDDSEDSGASEGEKEVITVVQCRKYPYEGWYDICI